MGLLCERRSLFFTAEGGHLRWLPLPPLRLVARLWLTWLLHPGFLPGCTLPALPEPERPPR